MDQCTSLSICPFFNDQLATMPRMADTYKKKYCLGNSTQCARLMVAKAWGRERVPANLFPNRRSQAEALLQQG